MIKSIVERGRCYIEVLDTDKCYLVNHVPVWSSITLESLDEKSLEKIAGFVQWVWHPEFVLRHSRGSYRMTWYVDPYSRNDGHIRVGCALVHYDKHAIDIHSEEVRAAIKSIACDIMNAAINIAYTDDGDLAWNFVFRDIWSDDMRNAFLHVDGDYSWIG